MAETEVYCRRCGKVITEDVANCPYCGQEVPEEQRKLLRELSRGSEQRRVYVYGRRKELMSREVRTLLIIILILVIFLAICRITYSAVISATEYRENRQLTGQFQRGELMMSAYEYRLLQLPEGSTITRFNEQIRRLVNEGWEPVMMSGDTCVNILLRQEAGAAESSESAAVAATAETVA